MAAMDESATPNRSHALAVIMERIALNNRWLSEKWEAKGVVQDASPAGSPPKTIVEREGLTQILFPGYRLRLQRDEAEGYYLNLTSPEPKVFVLWRMDDDNAVPVEVTVSTEEGGRWLDGGHSVDGVPMPPEIYAWVGDYVERNYRPEPKKRIKPRSFIHPKDRVNR